MESTSHFVFHLRKEIKHKVRVRFSVLLWILNNLSLSAAYTHFDTHTHTHKGEKKKEMRCEKTFLNEPISLSFQRSKHQRSHSLVSLFHWSTLKKIKNEKCLVMADSSCYDHNPQLHLHEERKYWIIFLCVASYK